jgi:hypothetical protein
MGAAIGLHLSRSESPGRNRVALSGQAGARAARLLRKRSIQSDGMKVELGIFIWD